MKDKILMLMIGILLGAIITTIFFFIYFKTNNIKRMNNMPNMENGQMMDMPRREFQNGENPNGEMKMPEGNMRPSDAGSL